MEHDDPEKRIADLERQLTQPRVAGPGGTSRRSTGLTPEQIDATFFGKPPIGKRGYNEDDVDAFLERVADTLREPTAPGAVTPADVHNVAFSKPPWGKRGYNEDEVDDFLDLVESELSRRAPGQGG